MDNKNNSYHGIPRDQINWFPTINQEKCLSCLACVGFCKNDVYAEEDGKPVVKNPNNCVVGCTGCEQVCPASAITHPPKEYLVDLLQKKYKSNCSCGLDNSNKVNKTLTITWQRLVENNETCPRCGSTEKELEKAVQQFKEQNIDVILKKEELSLEVFKKNPKSSNQILFNGIALEELLKAKIGQSKCCGTCGDAECRTIELDENSYEVIPSEIIVQAGLKVLN